MRRSYLGYFLDETVSREFCAAFLARYLLPLVYLVLLGIAHLAFAESSGERVYRPDKGGCICERGLAGCGTEYNRYTSAEGKLVMCIQSPHDSPGWLNEYNTCPDPSHRLAGKPCPLIVGTYPNNGRSFHKLRYCYVYESLTLRIVRAPFVVAGWFYARFSWKVIAGVHLFVLLLLRVCVTAYVFPRHGNLFANVAAWFRNEGGRPNGQRVVRRVVPRFVPGQKRVKLPIPFPRAVAVGAAQPFAPVPVVRPAADGDYNEHRNRLLDLGLDEL